MNKSSKWIITIVVLVLAACACLSLIGIAAAGFIFLQTRAQTGQVLPADGGHPSVEAQPTQQSTPVPVPTRTPAAPEATPLPLPTGEGVSASDVNTLRTLNEEEVPVNNPIQLAERLKGVQGIAPTLPPRAVPLQVGDEEKFWVTNSDTDEKRQLTATLRYMNDKLYFWIENGVNFNGEEMRRLADTFAQKIYPTDREFFGSEWNPGVDSDPRLHVLYARSVGESVAGYFSSADEIPPAAFEFSNAREMFVLSADNVSLGDSYIYGVMAHEFQHMIHYYTDRNEETWMNEGFSVLAELLNGYDIGGFDYLFMIDPDLSLVNWPGPGQSAPNYGAAFLFLDYFLNRFGEQATKALVADPANGLESIDKVLQTIDAKDPATGGPIGADDLFADWAVANYLDDPQAAGGRYHYANYPDAPKASPTEDFAACPVSAQRRTVKQYGSDYIRLVCQGAYTLQFQGASQVALLPTEPYSGEYAFWSNRGDESDMTLTRTFDFTSVTGPITLSYRTWFDIESDYDYVYLLASLDGKAWQMLKPRSGTAENPNGSNFGWGYTGKTNGVWILEDVDLSEFAGKQVQLRFEYVTDAAVNGEGMLIDDIKVDAVNYFSNFEADDGGWNAEGFVRVSNRLPQSFKVSLILLGGQTQVIPFELNEAQSGSLDFSIGGDVEEAVLVVGGTARYTNQEALYTFSVQGR